MLRLSTMHIVIDSMHDQARESGARDKAPWHGHERCTAPARGQLVRFVTRLEIRAKTALQCNCKWTQTFTAVAGARCFVRPARWRTVSPIKAETQRIKAETRPPDRALPPNLLRLRSV